MQFMPRNFTIFKTNVICIVSFEGDIDIINANGNKLISSRAVASMRQDEAVASS